MDSKKIKIRTRFAPSPTGVLHIGGARTALFNWLWAKSQNGNFILRIEDTDQDRFSSESQTEIIKNLKWLGLDWDEGLQNNLQKYSEGPYQPYTQSQRLPIYKEHIEILLKKDKAYHCFCTPEQLATVKEDQKRQKLSKTGYNRTCRNLTDKQVQEKLDSKTPFVTRMKTPLEGETSFEDFLRGTITYDNQNIDDLVLFKSNGFPSYHLANVVDDHLMEISHVLRGEEWIPSAVKHILLYQYFNWTPPIFVHLPLILSPQGGKLSKRHGAISISHYQDEGITSESLNNYLALLGWNPGNNQEIMSKQELIQLFSLDRIQPKACTFDTTKLNWFNQQKFLQTPNQMFLKPVVKLFKDNQIKISSDQAKQIIILLKERCQKLEDFWEQGRFIFEDFNEYNPNAVKKIFKKDTPSILKILITQFSNLTEFTNSNLEEICLSISKTLEVGLGKINSPLRLAISGTNSGPSLFPMISFLGKKTVLTRLEKAIMFIEKKYSDSR